VFYKKKGEDVVSVLQRFEFEWVYGLGWISSNVKLHLPLSGLTFAILAA
jgi:hypothetical protein